MYEILNPVKPRFLNVLNVLNVFFCQQVHSLKVFMNESLNLFK